VTFFDGIGLFFEGARATREPGLTRYVWLPAAISGLVVIAGLTLAYGYTDDFGTWLEAQLPDWLDFLSWILVPLAWLVGLLISAWLFGFLAVLIASPFLGDLSLAVERRRYGEAPAPDIGLAAMVVTALGRELRKLAYHLPRLIAVFVLTLIIPGVNAIAPAIWLLFGAWMMAVQFADYPTENRNDDFRDTLRRLRGRRAASLGFGLAASLALSIPFLNFLLIPAAVAGGTLLWHRTEAVESGA